MNTFELLPKVELHLHLDCSLSYEVVKKMDPSVSEQQYLTEYIAPNKCVNLADFLNRTIKGIELMQSKENIQLVVHDLFKQMKADNILYAELRFAPLQHLQKSLTSTEVVAAAEEAMSIAIKETGIEARLILCTLRHFSESQSMETVKLVEQFKGTYVAGFDIAGNEAGFPIDNHVASFNYAAKNNISCTAHAGEARGADSVWETLQHFEPSRIGHGVRSIEDEKLVAHLKNNNIHLEICPTSNLQTNIYDRYEQHPVDSLYKKGVSININTDTRTITNITLNKEYKKLADAFGWTITDLYNCNACALKAAFIPEALRATLMTKLYNAYKTFM